jgi:hypothetical protein
VLEAKPDGCQFNENNEGQNYYLPWTVPVEGNRYDAKPTTEQSSNRRIDERAFHGIPSTVSNVKYKNRRELNHARKFGEHSNPSPPFEDRYGVITQSRDSNRVERGINCHYGD